MTLQEAKNILKNSKEISFQLPNGAFVAPHFHVTEIGKIDKTFVDCGGTLRKEKKVSFQLWEANDYDHRLHPEKLLKIIELSENLLDLGNEEIEVEYQGNSIEKFSLEFQNNSFQLLATQTDCLAKDNCGIPRDKMKLALADLKIEAENSCTPGGGCC
jgi:hypothetical protein